MTFTPFCNADSTREPRDQLVLGKVVSTGDRGSLSQGSCTVSSDDEARLEQSRSTEDLLIKFKGDEMSGLTFKNHFYLKFAYPEN